MPPKQAVVTKGYKFKQGVLAKDVIPSICKYPPREGKQFKAPTEFNQEKQIFYQDFESPADWPGDQEASVHNFNLDSSDKFTDKSQSQPQIYHESVLVVNRRPAQFVNVKEVIATKSRLSGRRFSHHEIQMSQFETIQDEIMVFGFSERPETEEEKQERVEKEEAAALANAKGKKDKKNVQEVDNTIQMVKEIKMSNIRIDNELPPLIRWIAGQLQLIKDFNIKDVNNGQSLYQKIYPQKNGFPIYNPNGKYWVKLYFMGQYQKLK